MSEFSNYIAYVDESGDHGLETIDPNYPVFVLALCIFRKDIYHQKCSPALQEFKFRHFGHDMVILHERDIRKGSGQFKALTDRQRREEFMEDLGGLMRGTEMTLIASAIRKSELQMRYQTPNNPYDLALGFCLERLYYFLSEREEADKEVHIIFESRGRKEDRDLELEFRRVCGGKNYKGEKMPFEAVFAPKSVNCCGLQIADLVARPIGRHILDPDQANQAFQIIETKFHRSSTGKIRGYGLKVFP